MSNANRAERAIPWEPTDEIIEAALTACGVGEKWKNTVMEQVRKHRGTPQEPGIVCEIRAVLALLNGVPLGEIKRGRRSYEEVKR